MSGIIERYNYDICLRLGCGGPVFISYRQKDNRYDGWVSEFVEKLEKQFSNKSSTV
jgi:hypothetical protein